MSNLSNKQREILEREAKILAVARALVVREGYQALGMERIAEELDYSRGTIYNHFTCKEEIVIAMAAQNAAKRVAMFRAAAEFKGVPRFRMLAICYAAECFVRQYPDYFLFEQILTLDSVREKTSSERQQIIHNCELQCMNIVAGIARDAVANDHLQLADGITAEQIVFGLWSLTSGAYAISLTSSALPQMGIDDPYPVIRTHVAAFLDGYHWQPLSGDYESAELLREIKNTLESALEGSVAT